METVSASLDPQLKLCPSTMIGVYESSAPGHRVALLFFNPRVALLRRKKVLGHRQLGLAG